MKSLASFGLVVALVSTNVFAADPTPAPAAGAGTGAAGTTGIFAGVTPAVGAAIGFGVVAVAAVIGSSNDDSSTTHHTTTTHH